MPRRKARLSIIVFYLATLAVAAPVASQQVRRMGTNVEGANDAMGGIDVLQLHIDMARRKLEALRQKAALLEQEIQDILKKLSNVETSDTHSAAEAKETGPQDITYRPPLAHISNRSNIGFVCRGDRIIHVDFEAINRVLADIQRQPPASVEDILQKAANEGRAETLFEIPDGQFNVRFVVTVDEQRRAHQSFELVEKPGVHGENIAQIDRADSEFAATIAAARPDGTDIQFNVFHDSFQVFRKARSIAWERAFEVGWFPRAPGEALQLGGGGGNVIN